MRPRRPRRSARPALGLRERAVHLFALVQVERAQDLGVVQHVVAGHGDARQQEAGRQLHVEHHARPARRPRPAARRPTVRWPRAAPPWRAGRRARACSRLEPQLGRQHQPGGLAAHLDAHDAPPQQLLRHPRRGGRRRAPARARQRARSPSSPRAKRWPPALLTCARVTRTRCASGSRRPGCRTTGSRGSRCRSRPGCWSGHRAATPRRRGSRGCRP
jgi:hypothetical protein